MRKQRTGLLGVIFDDFIHHQKLSLFLLVLVMVSAMCVLITTQQTRLLLNQRERLLLERDVLESEWRNLILEENVLADQKRIERQAISQLGMQTVTPKTETIIVIKSR
ncbi:cell division protein FtsL [Zophobihabitans entericus]|uniref:Cell division protein FtsL n=1 Tax=Zophobihabitans entericus TaxID=1635327 RepID=A0A6G9I9Q8_9GAMM|nr:cell division protein FtsL [Zophobihabitans entericus]QIQ20965.1 cell division protein FtsL [Zophobihabitans entericus]